MKPFRSITVLVLFLFFFFFFPMIPAVSGHGGKYTPPGDNVPPNLGKPGGSGTPGQPGTPTTPSPAPPGVARPRTPGLPGRPSSPSGFKGPRTGGMARRSRNASMGIDRWEFWWEKNKDAFLDLKNRGGGRGAFSGNSSFLTGRGRKETAVFSRRPSYDMVRKKVLPALIAALGEDDADVLDSAVLAAARVVRAEDAPAVLGLIKGLLASRYASVRQSACLSLGVLGSPAACGICYDLMVDNLSGRKLVGGKKVPLMTRSFAALSLGLIGSEKFAPKLRLVVDRGDQASEKDLVACAVTALGLQGETGAAEENARFLIRKIENPRMDPYIRARIPEALARLGRPEALAAVVKALRRGKREVLMRRSLAIAMGRLASIGDEEAANLLMRAVKEDRDALTRHFALIALGRIGARGGEGAVDAARRQRIADFLLGEISRPSRFRHRSWAALAASIQAVRHDAVQGRLIGKLMEVFPETDDPSEKSAVAVGLGLLDAVSSGPMLFEALKDTKNKALQGYLCIGLGLMRWNRAAEMIRGLAAAEPVVCLKLQAATALALLGDRSAVKTLVKGLETSRSLGIVSATARALGLLGDRGAVGPLAAILGDKKQRGLNRAFAAVALGILAEKTVLPWNARIAAGSNYSVRVDALAEATDIY